MVSKQRQGGPCCPCAGSHPSNGTRSASTCKTRHCPCRKIGRQCTNCGPKKLERCTNCSAAEEEANVENPPSQPINNQTQRCAEEEAKDENPPSQPINSQTQRCDTQTQREDIAEDDFVQQFFDTAYGDTAARAANVGPPSEWKSMLMEAFGGKLFRSLYTLPDGNVGREFINTLAELKEKRVQGLVPPEFEFLFKGLVLQRDRHFTKAKDINPLLKRRICRTLLRGRFKSCMSKRSDARTSFQKAIIHALLMNSLSSYASSG